MLLLSDLAHFLITSTTREFRKKYLETVLSAYVNQLDDILESQGFPGNLYPAEAARRDYRRGMVLAITFTLFAMPRYYEWCGTMGFLIAVKPSRSIAICL